MAGQIVSYFDTPTQGAEDRTDQDRTVRDSPYGDSFDSSVHTFEQIGPYRILRVLGNGGMSTVYEGIREDIERRVAIKVLHPRLAIRQGAQDRSINEARAANRVEHPGLVQISDVGSLPDGGVYLVMEFLRGETLAERLSRLGGTVPVRQAIEYGVELANILHAAHQSGIVHRDLKPSNIMLVVDPQIVSGERIKLIDFGIAKFEETRRSDINLTPDGIWLGTPAYMSPEQCAGSSHIDYRSDIYALGVVMFQMLVGRPPFVDHNPGTVMARHQLESPPDARVRRAEIPIDLSRLVSELLAKDPALRPSLRVTVARLRSSLASANREIHANGQPEDEPYILETQEDVPRLPLPGTQRARHSARSQRIWLGFVSALSIAGLITWKVNHHTSEYEHQHNTDRISVPTQAPGIGRSPKGGIEAAPAAQAPAKHDRPTHERPSLEPAKPADTAKHRQSSDPIQKGTKSIKTVRRHLSEKQESFHINKNSKPEFNQTTTNKATLPTNHSPPPDDCSIPFGECKP